MTKTRTAAAAGTQASTLAAAIRSGDRRALAKGITLIESTRAADEREAEALLAALAPHAGRSIRIGLSGTPGAGKSTFIESFGGLLTARGHRVAVLAVDPSSRRSGGSILGDKTRMAQLARDPNAFIRPSPSAGQLGGVARRTRESILAVEAAGFDVVIVETVGVGQSETAVSEMTDVFVLIVSPGGGDELQGVKRGITELADIVVVNKADGDLAPAAKRAQADYQAALHLMRPHVAGWSPPVLAVSALERRGIGEVWDAVGQFRNQLGDAGLSAARRSQAVAWFWAELGDRLVSAFKREPAMADATKALEARVAAGSVPATVAARDLLERFSRLKGG